MLHRSTRITSAVPLVMRRTMSSGKAPLGIVFDIDGVLLRGSSVIPSATDALKRLDDARIPYIFLTNGGGYPEERKAESLSSILKRPIHKDQVIMCHTPMRGLVDQHKDDLVLLVGKRYNQLKDAAKGYGYKHVITVEEYHAHHPKLYTDMKAAPADEALKYCTERPIGAIMAMIDPIEWGREIQVCCDIMNSEGIYHKVLPKGAAPKVKYYNFCADFQYPTELQVARFGAGAFHFALSSLYQEFHGRPLQYTSYGKPHKASYVFAEKVLNDYAIQHGYSTNGVSRIYGIGDNPMTDIKGANTAGGKWVSVLVKTGLFQGTNDAVNPAKIVTDNVGTAVKDIINDFQKHEF